MVSSIDIWTSPKETGINLTSLHRPLYLCRGIQKRDMEQDLSWDHAAEQYEDVLVQAKYQW